MKTLHIFDFDDTLVRSDSGVIVNRADGKTERMSSSDYKGYVPEEGDELDFSEFDENLTDPEIVEEVFAELNAAVALDGPSSVVILTARANPAPVEHFLSDNSVAGVTVVAVGSSSPFAKAKYIMNRLKAEDFDEVVVFEDNVKNIRTIRKVFSDTDVKLETNRVTKFGVYTR